MKRVLITRPRDQAGDFAGMLKAVGFEPVFFPVIEIEPIEANAELDQALREIRRYAWVVFTSVNAVEIVYERFSALLQSGLPGVKVAAIGPKTAAALEVCGLKADFVPEEFVAEAILPGLGNLRGKMVLLPRAEIARQALPQAISDAGGIAHEIAVYKTMPAEVDTKGLAALKAGVDVITLTSPSTVHNFISITRDNGLDPLHLPGDPLYACIGPITEQAAREAGLENLIVAAEYTTEGLVKVILKSTRKMETL